MPIKTVIYNYDSNNEDKRMEIKLGEKRKMVLISCEPPTKRKKLE